MIECDIMKNNKGQALIEFILILPVFLLLIISVIDFGNIISKKCSLENDLDVIADMYKNDKQSDISNYINNNEIEISYKNDNEFIKINLSKDIRIISPMVNIILGKNYKIKTSKTIYINE